MIHKVRSPTSGWMRRASKPLGESLGSDSPLGNPQPEIQSVSHPLSVIAIQPLVWAHPVVLENMPVLEILGHGDGSILIAEVPVK